MTPEPPMSPDRWQRVEALFHAVSERPRHERAAALAASGADADTLAEVRALLDVEDEAADYFERPAGLLTLLGDGVGDGAPAEAVPPGTRVGPFVVAEEVGRGGMGSVYRAERADGAFAQTVALKVVRRGLDTEDVLARFRQERRILARLQHPNIARLLDGGATEDGRPWLAMEFVEGEPITARARRLPVRERLALFRQVCDAVAYAHRGLVVHRDLKPSNVLVTEAGEVKLLDFGIAKLLEDTGEDVRTRAGARLLTPAYAAPEQVRGEAVTTATDVYALGALLHELLTGQRPAEPERPARSEPARLRGDLGTICRKALAEEPERRYSSAEALGEDVGRYLGGLPLRARPDRLGYRAGRFVRRHWAGVAAAAAFVLLLAGAVVALAVQQRATARERDRAEAVAAFLTDLFESSDPSESRGRTLLAREVLDAGAARIAALDADPATRASLAVTLGRIYRHLGLYDQAAPLLRAALEEQRAAAVPLLPLTETLLEVGALEERLGHFPEARAAREEALALRRPLGPRHPAVAAALHGLASSLASEGAFAEAQGLLEEAVAAYRTAPKADPEDLAASLSLLAYVHQRADAFEPADAALREALRLQRRHLGPDHPALVGTLKELGALRYRQGDLAAAESLLTDAVALHRRLYPEGGPSLAGPLNDLALVQRATGRLDDAERSFREVLALYRTHTPENGEFIGTALHNLAWTLKAKGDTAAAVQLFREALAVNRDALGPGHLNTSFPLLELGRIHLAAGEAARAEAAFRESLAIRQGQLPEDNPLALEVQGLLGHALTDLRRFREAEAALTEYLAGVEAAALGEAWARHAHTRLAALYEAWGRPDRAAPHRDAVAGLDP